MVINGLNMSYVFKLKHLLRNLNIKAAHPSLFDTAHASAMNFGMPDGLMMSSKQMKEFKKFFGRKQ